MLAMYVFFLLLSTYAYAYMQSEPARSPPVFVVETEGEAEREAEREAEGGTEAAAVEIPFEPVTLSFRDVWYSVTPKGSKGEELDLLKGVSGYFEPGTMTALVSTGRGRVGVHYACACLTSSAPLPSPLCTYASTTYYLLLTQMGSSGAGKTTLLDVLADRKNTGIVRGGIYVNGKKRDKDFRHLMGYVEQFDSLSPNDTAREAVEFSAAMRLPAGE
jgi:ABC-type multidrug transport system fused ATPase/permease subunit